MKDKLTEALNHISDKHIAEASGAKSRRRYQIPATIAAILALCYYYLLPFSLDVRQTLVILAFAPIGSTVPIFTAELKEDVGLSSTINSIAIVISVVIIVTLLTVML